jgi:hypothetical protein
MKELASRVKRLSMHDEEDEELNLIDNVIDGPAKTRLTD